MIRRTMSKTRNVVVPLGATVAMLALSVVTASGPAGASSAPDYSSVAGSVAPWVAGAHATGDVAASQPLSIEVWLRPRVLAATRYATAVSTPGTASFHHYLSPAAYAARFGASAKQAHAVESWLRHEGFTGATTDTTRAYVRATATTARIDAAFKVQLKTYSVVKGSGVNAGPYALRSNDRSVSIPSSLAGSVLGVTGLENAAPTTSLDHLGGAATPVQKKTACSQYYGEVTKTGFPEEFGTTTFPTEVCGYSGHEIREAYGADLANSGTGQTVALVEVGLAADMFKTLDDYAALNGLPAPSADRYSELALGKGTECGDPFALEEQLDVESSYSLAPGANQIVIGGDSCNQGDFGLQSLFNADEAVLDGSDGHPLASIASNSWEGGSETQPPAFTNIEHSYLLQAASEGVGMYFSAGDGSGVETPSSDPYAVAVGGTTLGIGATGNRLFETGWSTGISFINRGMWSFAGEQGAAGGGTSLLWREPAYQDGVVPPFLSRAPGNRGSARAVPDISADADPFTGFAVGLLTTKHHVTTYGESDIGGTSLSAPLVAGMVAAAQQGTKSPFGFVNPLLYKLAGTSALNDPLPLNNASPAEYRGVTCNKATCEGPTQVLTTFDDQAPGMDTSQVTLKGYDTMTGVGTPAGQAFITALRALAR
jgi:subtilase family serine protease